MRGGTGGAPASAVGSDDKIFPAFPNIPPRIGFGAVVPVPVGGIGIPRIPPIAPAAFINGPFKKSSDSMAIPQKRNRESHEATPGRVGVVAAIDYVGQIQFSLGAGLSFFFRIQAPSGAVVMSYSTSLSLAIPAVLAAARMA